MILAVDVHYRETAAQAAGVAFDEWTDAEPAVRFLTRTPIAADYRPGAFYRRELPCILALLNEHGLQPDTILIDGFVYLDGTSRPGLGWHLYDALDGKTAVIGVAKRPFRGIPDRHQVTRGGSHRPLYVTSAGIPLETARSRVEAMHGPYRLPTLLKLADRESRAAPWEGRVGEGSE